jgi:hypothetical protein
MPIMVSIQITVNRDDFPFRVVGFGGPSHGISHRVQVQVILIAIRGIATHAIIAIEAMRAVLSLGQTCDCGVRAIKTSVFVTAARRRQLPVAAAWLKNLHQSHNDKGRHGGIMRKGGAEVEDLHGCLNEMMGKTLVGRLSQFLKVEIVSFVQSSRRDVWNDEMLIDGSFATYSTVASPRLH